MNQNNNSMENLWDRLSHSHQEVITLKAKEYPATAERVTSALKNNVIWGNLEVGDIQGIMSALGIALGDQTLYMLYYGDGIIRENK